MLFALVACAAFGSGQAKKYVRPNDVVTVNCAEEPAISKDYTITRDGFIIMQYAGAVRVGGLTETAAANKISQALVKERILPTATVTLQVDSSKLGVISYIGAVTNSGALAPHPGMRLSDVVKAAQPTSDANLQHVRIVTYAGNVFVVNFAAYDGANNVNNPEVLNGDTVCFDSNSQSPVQPGPTGSTPTPNPVQQGTQPVPAPTPIQHPTQPTTYPEPQPEPTHHPDRTIIVQGAVASPGPVAFHAGITLTEAIQEAGGLYHDSDLGNVTVQRKIDGQIRTYRANVEDIQKGMAGDIALRANDLVDVPGRGHGVGISKQVKIGALVLLALIILH